ERRARPDDAALCAEAKKSEARNRHALPGRRQRRRARGRESLTRTTKATKGHSSARDTRNRTKRIFFSCLSCRFGCQFRVFRDDGRAKVGGCPAKAFIRTSHSATAIGPRIANS